MNDIKLLMNTSQIFHHIDNDFDGIVHSNLIGTIFTENTRVPKFGILNNGVSFQNQRGILVEDPLSETDCCNKRYVDGEIKKNLLSSDHRYDDYEAIKAFDPKFWISGFYINSIGKTNIRIENTLTELTGNGMILSNGVTTNSVLNSLNFSEYRISMRTVQTLGGGIDNRFKV